MSYVVTIQREPPIAGPDLRDLVSDDPTLSLLSDGPEAIHGIVWRYLDGRPRMPLTFDEGSLWGTPRGDTELEKMQELAAKLGGQLLGEEGEPFDYTRATASSGCAGRAAGIVFVLICLAIAAATT